MKYLRKIQLLTCQVLLLCCCLVPALAQQSWTSRYVHVQKDDKLRYVPDAKGNTIPDFSLVGYCQQARPIPSAPVVKTVFPSGSEDDLRNIQAAIDEVARLPLNGQGLRGTVLLEKGEYRIPGTIRIQASGIVLRGKGMETKLVATGKDKRNLISVTGTGNIRELSGSRRPITDPYVPAGTHSFTISDAGDLQPGDSIVLFRPGTEAWIDAIRMNEIEVRDSSVRQWQPGEYDLHFERVITRIEGRRITIDNPVVMPMEAAFGGGAVYRYHFEGRIRQVGVENLYCVSEYAGEEDEAHAWTAVYFNRVENGWVQDVTACHFGYACVDLGNLSKNITVQDCASLEPKSKITGGRRYSFNNDGQCNLFMNCFASGGRHDFVTGARVCGPNVFFHCKAVKAHADIGPHHRWAVGTLYDNIVTDGEINIQDRGNWGTGHGWAGVTQVLWNCTASRAAVQNPWTSGYNYSIGLTGAQYEGRLKGRPAGEWEGLNRPGLTPVSLYLAQRAALQQQRATPFREETIQTLRAQVLKAAAEALQQQPVTIAAFPAARSVGGLHDFYSEGDYWWPDTAHPEGPYIQRDGMSNPDNFTAHREALVRFSRIIGALASAYQLTGDEKYVRHAMLHAKAWFTDSATYMRPSLLYAQAIRGRATGRSIGIIDAIQLMEVAQGLYVMQYAPAMDVEALVSFKQWFRQYLQWLTTHPYGLQEMEAKNNHGTCWVMQAAVFARFAGDQGLLSFCRERYKTILLPGQMASDGSFPLELARTKPYGYSLFNLDALAAICQVLSAPGDDLWSFQTPDGKSMQQGIRFLFPYIRQKESWPYKKDVLYWECWPVAQPALLFGAIHFKEKSWWQQWKQGDHAPTEPELIRNLPVRHPLIWL